MARGFRRERGRYVATLESTERRFVLSLIEQTRALLTPEDAIRKEPVPEPADEFEALMLSAGLALPESDAAPGSTPREEQLEDPALARLLPAGHRQDEQIAEEFRRLTEAGIRDQKAARLAAVADLLRSADKDVLRLDAAAAADLLVSLTDVRLVLGERLNLVTDRDASQLAARMHMMTPDDPHLALAIGYDFLTWLQETLAAALLG